MLYCLKNSNKKNVFTCHDRHNYFPKFFQFQLAESMDVEPMCREDGMYIIHTQAHMHAHMLSIIVAFLVLNVNVLKPSSASRVLLMKMIGCEVIYMERESSLR